MKNVSFIFLIGFLLGFGIGAGIVTLFDLQGPNERFAWWFCCCFSGAFMGAIFTGIYNAAKEPAK